MKETGILFTSPMIRALLDGSKTQTRRVVKPQFAADAIPVEMPATDPTGGWVVPGHSGVWWCDAAANPDDMRRCPYGQPGDRLWVRESWQYADWTDDGYPFIGFHADAARLLRDRIPEEWAMRVEDAWITLSAPANFDIDQRAADRRWRPSIHMPRWASRITLEITSVRVERLSEISEGDAQAEGAFGWAAEQDTPVRDLPEARLVFRQLWESINGPGSWDANPWAWAVSFRRLP